MNRSLTVTTSRSHALSIQQQLILHVYKMFLQPMMSARCFPEWLWFSVELSLCTHKAKLHILYCCLPAGQLHVLLRGEPMNSLDWSNGLLETLAHGDGSRSRHLTVHCLKWQLNHCHGSVFTSLPVARVVARLVICNLMHQSPRWCHNLLDSSNIGHRLPCGHDLVKSRDVAGHWLPLNLL